MVILVITVLLGGGWVWKRDVNKPKMEIGQSREEAIPELKVAVVADIHDDWVNLKKALDMAKERGVKMVIVAGDMTLEGEKEELARAKEVMETSGIKYKVVPGNHDLYQGAGMFGEVFGDDFGSIYLDDKNKIILLNNGSWKGLGVKQKTWLEKEVVGCREIRCIVVGHMPLNRNYSAHVMGEDSKMVTQEAAWLLKLLVDNGVKEMMVGHIHHAQTYTLQGLTTNMVGAISRDRNTQKARYTELVVGDSIEKRVVVLE